MVIYIGIHEYNKKKYKNKNKYKQIKSFNSRSAFVNFVFMKQMQKK